MTTALPLRREANFINGQWVGAEEGATFDVVNPATQAVVGTVPKSGVAETRRAIAAAEAAFPGWSSRTFICRSRNQLRSTSKCGHPAR